MYIYLHNFIKLIYNQTVTSFRNLSILGVFLLFTIFIQCLTGIMLSFSLVNDSMLICISRDTEDMDDLYTDDFFWLHERGVDFIFTFMYIHLLRKLYMKSYYTEQESSWKSGSLMFLLIHGIIFFGLVLCCTHLSDITLKIAAKIVSTLTAKYGSFGYWLFTDETLNTDTIIRLMYLHYILPFILIYISIIHMVDMHYGHRDSNKFFTRKVSYFWFGEVLKTEIILFFNTIMLFSLIFLFLFEDNEPLSYEIFMWGDLGLMSDVRFLGVAPHWYFRAYMGWLIFCPHHYIGVFGMLYYMIVIYFQPNIMSVNNDYYFNRHKYVVAEMSTLHNITFTAFIMSLLYCVSYLPYGRFFTSVGGNSATTFAYLYVFFYLGCPITSIVNRIFLLRRKYYVDSYIRNSK